MKHILLTVLFLLGLLVDPVQAGTVSDANMIAWWAPAIFQQDDTRNPLARENVFTVVNYDRDWRGNNNWENLSYYPPTPAVYYSLAESDTHYFIGYYLYYPRRTGRNKHEHDMVGALTVVKKGSEKFGHLELLLVFSDNNWLTVKGSQVWCKNGHPILKVSDGNHEISNERAPGPGGAYPRSPADSQAAGQCGYKLVDLQELWQHRNDIGPNRTFNRWGYFDGDSYLNVAAPWAWEYRRINWLANPAEILQRIKGRAKQPVKYLSNPYAST
ncbi:hypothetical protein SOV_28000 [Sporomusa ovata DSM 2662]|uniref:Uncharacterized protein n=1 Tax=Sporomusa ovata TaxID=2378 RepID=A0A0U1L5A5_9FIRM|nr:hypothetical protein [Sporomusa ovata]EQB26110.1 hypothetical protein SOV_4c07830 [Sporomusa ovata DSM 2662]CQR74685.1 hypothetical protein SpAn4DRAFT_1147 [Sporomusa ovata]